MSNMSSRPRRDPWIALPLLMIGGPLLTGLIFMLAYSTGLIGLLAEGFRRGRLLMFDILTEIARQLDHELR